MEELWTDNFKNDSNNFNYSSDVSNNEPTLAGIGWSSSSENNVLAIPSNLTLFDNTIYTTAASNGGLEQFWGQASLPLMAADSERVPQAGNHQFLAQSSEETLLPQVPQATNFRSTIYGIGDTPQGDGQFNAEGLISIDKEPELLDHTIQSGDERSPKDKNTSMYSCLYLSCCNKSFGDKGGLDRHMREVHSSLTFICPVVSCPRNKRGFNRKYNLLDHQKRRHKREISRSLHGSGVSEERPEHTDGGQTFRYGNMTSESNPDDTAQALITSENEGVCLRSKLKSLRATRAEIDKDINLLERALNIISDMY